MIEQAKNTFVRCGYYVCGILMIALFYNLNTKVPFFADDYAFALRGHSLVDAIKNMQQQYFSMSGRWLIVLITSLFLGSKIALALFNIVNSLIAFLLIHKISSIINPSLKNSLFFSLVTFLTLWFYVPNYGEMFFWKTGAIQYLWSLYFILILLDFTLKLYFEANFTASKVTCLAYFILAFVSACFLQNVTVSVMFLLMVLNIWYYAKHKVCNYELLILSLFFIIGGTIALLAPGNEVRASYFAKSNNLDIIHKVLYFSIVFWQHYKDLVLTYALLVLCAMLFKYEIQKISYIYFILGLVTTYVMIGAPGIFLGDIRVFFVGDVLVLIGILNAVPFKLILVKKINRSLLYVGIMGLSILFMFNYLLIAKFYTSINEQLNTRIKMCLTKDMSYYKVLNYWGFDTKYTEINYKWYFSRDAWDSSILALQCQYYLDNLQLIKR